MNVYIHSISVLVNNTPGVLARVSDLFGRSGYNIDRLQVRAFKEPAYARIRIITSIDKYKIEAMVEQLSSLLDVIQVRADIRHSLADHSRYWRATQALLTMKHIQLKQSILSSRLTAFWLVAYGLFITLFGTNIPSPLYSLYRTQWGLSPAFITLLFAAYAIIVIPTIVIAGQLSDRIGRRAFLVIGVLFAFLGSISFAFAASPGLLLLSRMLQGVSVGMLNGVAVAALTELDETRNRHKAALVAAAAVTLGNALAPVYSGLLGQYGPFPTQLSYSLHAIFSLPCIVGLLYLNEKRTLSLDKIRLHRPYVPYAIRSPFILASSTSFISWAVMSLVMSIIPSYFQQLIDVSSLWMAGAAITLVLCCSTTSQLAFNRKTILTTVSLGFVFMSFGLIGLTCALLLKSKLLLLGSVILIGVGHGPAYSGSLAYLNERVTDSTRGDTVSAFYVITYLGVAVPILGLGLGASIVGLFPAIVAFAAGMIILMIINLVSWIRHVA
ncbi:MAG: acetolactate synthase small subunit, partial [Paenibacillus sp.]|nr:acetolactate synthase small subunit [Paenibacillus sp.]